MEKISAPKTTTGDLTDFLVVMTSDLVIHTLHLSLKGAMDSNVNPQQIKLLSSYDTKNVINRSEIPKLNRVIKSAVLDHERGHLLFVLFENLSYFIVTIADANSSSAGEVGQSNFITTYGGAGGSSGPFKPIVEFSCLTDLEVEANKSLVEVVCSKNHIYKLVQN